MFRSAHGKRLIPVAHSRDVGWLLGEYAMHQEAIFAPMIAFTLLVFLLWMQLGFVRISGSRRGVISPEYIRLGSGSTPPEYVVAIHRHFSNLFEVPLLFYAGCISLFVLDGVDTLAMALTWLFVLMRCVHTLIVLRTNRPQQRVGPYVLSCCAVWGLWFLVLWRATASAA